MPESEILRIATKDELQKLAKRLGVRDDWHEPDEQGLEAKVKGKSFDNCGFWGSQVDCSPEISEIYVQLIQNKKMVAEVNLATLFSFACRGGENG